MHEVSDGERRRVQIVQGLMAPWDVLLLDEVPHTYSRRWSGLMQDIGNGRPRCPGPLKPARLSEARVRRARIDGPLRYAHFRWTRRIPITCRAHPAWPNNAARADPLANNKRRYRRRTERRDCRDEQARPSRQQDVSSGSEVAQGR
jgi:hypothetical protein